jgi:hypothetical protein
MADRKITDLQLRSNVNDDVNFPVDDGIQTYRVTAPQVFSYIRPKFSTTRVITAAASAVTGTDVIIYLDPTSASFTQALPAVASLPTGFVIQFKNIATNGNLVTLDASSTQLIDEDETLVVGMLRVVRLINNGTKWVVLQGMRYNQTLRIAGSPLGYSSGGAGPNFCTNFDPALAIINTVGDSLVWTQAGAGGAGDTFVPTDDGTWNIKFSGSYSGGVSFYEGITVNSSNLNTGPESLALDEVLALGFTYQNGPTLEIQWTGRLFAGDVVRAQHNKNFNVAGTQFYMTRIGD